MGSLGTAREVQLLLNRLSAGSAEATAARLAALLLAGEAEALPLANALVRCACACLPAVYALLCEHLGGLLGELWTSPLRDALAAALNTRVRGGDAFVEQLLAAGPSSAAVAKAAGGGPEAGYGEEDDRDASLTGDTLCEGGQLETLLAIAAQQPWRRTETTSVMCGVEVRFRQTPRFGPRRADAGSTGLVAWAAAELMAWHLEHGDSDAHPHLANLRRGCSALELGCGVGLCAVAAALQGGRVVATDGSDDVVSLCAENCKAAIEGRPGSVTCLRLRWGDDDELAAALAALPPSSTLPPLVLLSDGLFFVDAHTDLMRTLRALAAALPGCVLLLAHTWRKRALEQEFIDGLCAGGFSCRDITPTEGVRVLPGTVLLLFETS